MKVLRKIAFVMLLLCLWACSAGNKTETAENKTDPAEVSVNTGNIIKVAIDIKDYGTVKAELYEDVAPKSVANFVSLVKDGFYDGNRFHRIIDGFMIQGGADMSGTVKNIEGEFEANGFKNDLKHTEGVLSMARAKDMNSATSQFFIMVGDAGWLDGQYAAFGKVYEGLDIVKKIASDARPIDNNGTIKEEEMPQIESIRIIEE